MNRTLLIAMSVCFLLSRSCGAGVAVSEYSWPNRVLITNDDGINDPNMLALARAFSQVCETYVIAPQENKSGATHLVSAFRTHSLSVESHDLGSGIKGYGVDGYPGDCVLLALQGLMRDNPPDLVVAGINGGPNLGFDWLASGTIGAARLAAFWGVPAIAVSGIDEAITGALDASVRWVVRLAQSSFVHQLESGQYLTISIPRIPPAEIKGVRVAERAGILLDFTFQVAPGSGSSQSTTVWQLGRPHPLPRGPANRDAALYDAGFVVIVPMLADEHDHDLFTRLQLDSTVLPDWP
ncbi:MAG: 5'/3'-nucleotidase SurE [Candidatus Eisenbacteria sp.]|nr:5'/3'-nucleotidase SurE [Candidatus Eisenbacteria bacterium]